MTFGGGWCQTWLTETVDPLGFLLPTIAGVVAREWFQEEKLFSELHGKKSFDIRGERSDWLKSIARLVCILTKKRKLY